MIEFIYLLLIENTLTSNFDVKKKKKDLQPQNKKNINNDEMLALTSNQTILAAVLHLTFSSYKWTFQFSFFSEYIFLAFFGGELTF